MVTPAGTAKERPGCRPTLIYLFQRFFAHHVAQTGAQIPHGTRRLGPHRPTEPTSTRAVRRRDRRATAPPITVQNLGYPVTRSLRFCTEIDEIVLVLGDLVHKGLEILHFRVKSGARSGHPYHRVGPILHRLVVAKMQTDDLFCRPLSVIGGCWESIRRAFRFSCLSLTLIQQCGVVPLHA